MPTSRTRDQSSSALTVMISSRFEELGTSRRAAFDAVLDAGCIPIMYEGIPLDEVFTPSSEESPPKIVKESLRAERRRIDDLLNMSDAFLGIYADSLGDPQPHLAGLRPIEYELLRFCVASLSDHRTAESVLNEYFPSPDNSTAGENDEVRALHSGLWKDIRDLRPQLCTCGRAAPESSASSSGDLSRSAPSARTIALESVFKSSILLMKKVVRGDRATSSLLQDVMSRLPHREYRAERPSIARGVWAEHGDSVVPAPQKLYEDVFEWARATRTSLGRAPLCEVEHGTRRQLVVPSEKTKGYVRAVVRELFVAGYNVEQLQLGDYMGRRSMLFDTCAFRPDPMTEPEVAEAISATLARLAIRSGGRTTTSVSSGVEWRSSGAQPSGFVTHNCCHVRA